MGRYVFTDSAAVAEMASNSLDNSALRNLAFQIIADKLPEQLIDKLYNALALAPMPALEEENLQHEDGVVAMRRSVDSGLSPDGGYSKSTTMAGPTNVS